MRRGRAVPVESAWTGFGVGYNIQNIATAMRPASPEKEHRMWYQYYLHGERGRAGLTENRRAFCRLLWSLWSPNWRFDDDTYACSAAAFDNPDFVDVIVHSYRHQFRTGRWRSSVRRYGESLVQHAVDHRAHDHTRGGHGRCHAAGGKTSRLKALQGDAMRTASRRMQVTIFRRRHQKRSPPRFLISTPGPLMLPA
jgi:hypothetical protein